MTIKANLKKTFKYLELTSDVLWIFASKFSLIAKGPLTAIFIVIFLSAEDQGLWYTFLSLSALSALAELGFTLLISQLVSHEFDGLSFRHGFIRGKKNLRDKLFSLIRFSIKLYVVIVPFAAIILLVAGLFILSNELFLTKIAWILFAFISALSLLVSLFQSIYQGLDKISDVYRIRTIGNLIVPIFSITFMFLGFSVWALVISTFISVASMSYFLLKITNRFWIQVFRNKPEGKFNWSREILPLQGKYAVSWASGYAVFHLIVPVTFKIFGAEVAGKLGLLISLSSGITYLSTSWLDSVIPKLNFLVARKSKLELDKLFTSSVVRGYLIFFLCCGSLLLIVYLANIFNFYSERILPLNLVALFLLVELAIVSLGFLAKYLRAHRAEPFYLVSLINAILVVAIIIWALPKGLALAFCWLILTYWLVVLPFGIFIFRKFVTKFYAEDNE